MDKPNDDANIKFPPEYIHLAETVQNARDRIQQIDEQIKNLPKDKGPELRFNPPGFSKFRQHDDRETLITNLEKKKSQIKSDINIKVENEIKDADSNTAASVREAVQETLEPNPYLGMDATERQTHREQRKDINTSQNFAYAYLKHNQEVSPTKKEKQPTKDVRPSESLKNSLNYTKAAETSDSPKAPQIYKEQKDIDIDFDKE